jgi:hypothetical protein
MDEKSGAMAGDSGDAPEKRNPSVFLSYSRTDLERARPVIALLEAAGFDLWWDGRLEGGENYLATTEHRLESADCVAVLWSQTSVASHWVRDEAQRGRERGCLVPLSLDGTMAPLGFRQFQLLDISGWSGDPGDALAGRILAAVRARTGQGNAVNEPPVPFTVPPPAAPASPPATGLALSRRTLIIGGATLAGGAGLVGLWQSGLLGSSEAKAISRVVLPFRNLTGDVSKAWFSNGLSNELRAVLAHACQYDDRIIGVLPNDLEPEGAALVEFTPASLAVTDAKNYQPRDVTQKYARLLSVNLVVYPRRPGRGDAGR